MKAVKIGQHSLLRTILSNPSGAGLPLKLMRLCARFFLCVCLAVASAIAFAGEPARPQVPDSVVLETDVEYGRADGVSLRLDLARPRQIPKERMPVVVWIHGGGWKAGNRASGLSSSIRWAREYQMIGVTISYRFSGQAKWPAQIHDCKAAIRWLRANANRYHLNPERIGVWGTSAGGHLSAFLAVTGDRPEFEGNSGSPGHSSRVACAVVLAGPSDFLAYKDFQRRSWGQPNSPGGAEHDLFGHSLDGPERNKVIAASPVSYARAALPPILIVHGTNDDVVPFDQARRFHEALRKVGATAYLVRVEGGGHGVVTIAADPINRFFRKYLLGEDVRVSDEVIPAKR